LSGQLPNGGQLAGSDHPGSAVRLVEKPASGTCAGSDPVGWEQLYLAHRPAMLDAAARRVRDRPDLDAADVVQEVFASVIADPPETPPDWGVLLVRLTDSVRIGRDTRPVEEAVPEEDTAVVVVRRGTAEEIRGRIQRLMGYMTERQREVTRLRLFDGLSVGEIATLTGTSSSNVSQIVIRCLTKLGPSLVRCDGFDEPDLERLRPSRCVLAPRPSPPRPAEPALRAPASTFATSRCSSRSPKTYHEGTLVITRKRDCAPLSSTLPVVDYDRKS
jgi:RNA polymerase sigma factor (sigma-70 family)